MLKTSELISVCTAIDPDNQSAGTVTSTYVKLDKFVNYLAVFQAGVLASTNTTVFSIVQASDGSGTGVKTITGKTATTLTEAGTDSDKQVIIALNPNELDLAGGFYWVALRSVTATAAGYVSGVLLGINPNYTPASAYDATTVDEVL